MSVILWYKVVIEEQAAAGLLAQAAALVGGGLPLKISNDIFSGQYILDADIHLTMKDGATPDEFSIRLPNLPPDVAEKLKGKHKEAQNQSKPLLAKIHLGYFEDGPTFSSKPVLTGAVLSIQIRVTEEGLSETEITGQELGGYRLRSICAAYDQPGKGQIDDLVADLARQAEVSVAKGSLLKLPRENFTFTARNGLTALEEIAQQAGKPVVVRDNQIFLADAVGSETGPKFDAAENIVQLDEKEYREEIPAPCARRESKKVKTTSRSTVKMKVLGNPALRVGQMVTVKAPSPLPPNLRAAWVEHIFSTERGYICQMTLVSAAAGTLADASQGAKAVVDRVNDVIRGDREAHPHVDVGQVRQYLPGSQGKHLASLLYGQTPDPNTTTPSVETPVDEELNLHNRPILSPFAWHKTGLMLPMYEGMRPLLLHNRGLVNDAVVSGFLWSENPLFDRPKNKAGDYWLCLPTELGSDGRPAGKGANDLIDAQGLRVIQVKGLHIQVGQKVMIAVGERPNAPAEDTLTIEHSSGTKITITSNGALKIETKNQELTLTNGSVNLKLSGSSVEVS